MKYDRRFVCSVLCGAGTALSALLLPACGDDDSSDSTGGSGGSSDATGGAAGASSSGGSGTATGGGAGAGNAEPPVYAFTAQVFGETETVSYVLLSDRIEPDASLSIEDAVLEVPGRALGAGPNEGGVLFVVTDSAPTVSRYTLEEDGTLSSDGSVSFLPRGVTKFGEYGGQFQFVSDTKAYWFDGATAQIVVWDPSTMKVTGSISLEDLAHDGENLSFTAAPVLHGDKLYTFPGWRLSPMETVARAAVVVIDTNTDEATIVEDTRSGYVRDGVLGSDGKLYVATEAFGSAAYHLNTDNPVPRLLRFDPETETFDADFSVDLSSLFDGATAGSLVVGPGNQAFLRVLDAEAAPDAPANARVLASASAWGWATLTLGDDPSAILLEDAELSSGSTVPFTLGTRVFAPVFIGNESTSFVELTKDGPASGEALSIPGLVFSAVKLR